MFLELPALTNAAMWAGIVGFLSPLVIQFLVSSGLPKRIQALIAFAFCVLISIPTVYFADDFTFKNWTKTALLVFTVAIASYKGFWKPVGVTPSNATDSH